MERALAVDGSVEDARRVVITPGAPAPRRPRRLVDEAGVLAGLVVVALIFGALIGPQFFRAANLELMARQTVIVCVAALGMTMVIVSGGIDLSVGSIVALSTVVTALLLRAGVGPALAALGAVGAGALCGTVNTISASVAGLAGVMEYSNLSVGVPTVAVGLELDVIAAVIIGGGSLLGGKGSIVGTIAGAAIMAIIQIGCSQQGLPNWVQEIVTGTIIVFAVALDQWRSRR